MKTFNDELKEISDREDLLNMIDNQDKKNNIADTSRNGGQDRTAMTGQRGNVARL